MKMYDHADVRYVIYGVYGKYGKGRADSMKRMKYCVWDEGRVPMALFFITQCTLFDQHNGRNTLGPTHTNVVYSEETYNRSLGVRWNIRTHSYVYEFQLCVWFAVFANICLFPFTFSCNFVGFFMDQSNASGVHLPWTPCHSVNFGHKALITDIRFVQIVYGESGNSNNILLIHLLAMICFFEL